MLAYSTVSQLGYMFIGVGVGAYAAGVFHLMTHAFFKALLFLGSGAVIHAMHQAYHHTRNDGDAQDMRNMGGLKKYMPITWATMWIATLAIAGVWPFAGFFSKDEIIWQAAAHAVGPYAGWYKAIWLVALAAAVLTAFYMTRMMVMTFHGENRTGEAERKHLGEVPAVMWVPLAALAVLSVVGGWINVPHAVSELPVLGWIPHSEWLHEWLHPLMANADAIYAANMPALAEAAPFGGSAGFWAVASFALAVAVIVIASRVVGGAKHVPAAEAPEPVGLKGLLYHKWYVDEIYDAVVVRPIVSTSRALWRFVDQGIIDGTVNGLGQVSRLIGWAGTRIQTGQVNAYAFAIAIGVLILLGFVAL